LHDFSQLSQEVADIDEAIGEKDDDFMSSGLKNKSLLRICRLSVVHKRILIGAIGEVSLARLNRIKSRLSDWLINK
jgi:mRNA interferase MazF